MTLSHKTGFLFQFDGGFAGERSLPPVETWHRTLSGAQRAKVANEGRGQIYRVIDEETTELIER